MTELGEHSLTCMLQAELHGSYSFCDGVGVLPAYEEFAVGTREEKEYKLPWLEIPGLCRVYTLCCSLWAVCMCSLTMAVTCSIHSCISCTNSTINQ